MESLASVVARHELLLLFIVICLGLLLGRLQLGGSRLGSAGVLFGGLAFGALLKVPVGAELTALKEFGLVVFVYCVGLTSAPGLFSAWKKGGLRLNAVVLAALACGAGVAVIGGQLLG